MRNSQVILAASMIALQTSAAWAQSGGEADTAPNTDEIIVTAQKRAENLQQVPVAVSAFRGDTLSQRNISDLTQVATLVPNVNVQQRLSYGVVTIRGIGFDQLTAGAEASVAVHQDGVYIARPTAALAGFFDVERLEISRGPQGTIYGRNSTGGAANIVSRKPTTSAEGYVTVGYGNYNALNVEAALSGPLVDDVLLARVAVKFDQHDGYGENLFNGRDIADLNSRAIRGLLQWKPSADLSILVAADYYKQKDSAFALQFGGYYVPCPVNGVTFLNNCGTSVGGVVSPRLRDIANDRHPENDREFYGVSGTVDWSITDAIDLKSITAYRRGNSYYAADNDSSTADMLFVTREERSKQFSQEVQLLGTSDRLKWILGGFYLFDRTNGLGGGSFGPRTGRGLFRQGGLLDTKAYAVFGQATYNLSDMIALTLGGRYSSERKELANEIFSPGVVVPNPFAGIVRKVKFSSFTPKFGAEFRPADGIMIFANAQKGFKSGGFALGALTPSFAPETIWSYEGGIKATIGRNRINLTGFHYDYSDVQVGRVENVSTVISNAASARVRGLELEAFVPISAGLRLDVTSAYLDSKFTNYTTADPGRLALGPLDLSGNRLAQAPKFTANIGLQNTWAALGGEVTLRGEAYHASRTYFTPYNVNVASQAAYELFNVFLNYDSPNGWNASIYVRNVANKTIRAGGYVSSSLFGAPVNVTLLPPRLVGAKLGYRF